MITTMAGVQGSSLVAPSLFDRLTQRVVRDDGLDPDTAAQVVDQALAFLATLPRRPTLRPSRLVDLGWHAFLLHTREYAEFCDRIAGRFLHHEPDDGPTPVECGSLAEVRQAITDAGYVVDPEMWANPANCGEVGCGAGRPPHPRALS
ncbi:MAG: glycine-rich domain-containing protein [Pseudonocardiaceae bacterium]